MTKKRLKRATALAMALVLMMGAVLPTAAYANATGADMDVHDTAVSQSEAADGSESSSAETGQERVLST